jgi:hypothetical protein
MTIATFAMPMLTQAKTHRFVRPELRIAQYGLLAEMGDVLADGM